MHSNGYAYYNRNIVAYKEGELTAELELLLNDVKHITMTFLLLLIICTPFLIMSTDYIDYLEGNDIPPEGAQYWVAPFVDQFVKENISLIDQNCLNYLREKTHLEFSE